MKDWSLFLTHPTYRNECSTSEDTLNSPRGRFWVFKVPSSVRVLGKFPIDSAVLSFPHDNVVCNHSCYECRRSNESSVCHKLWSILWLLGPVCLRTKECLVYQFAPNVDILGNFESNFWQLFHRFQLFLFEVMVVNAWCTESFYSPTRNVVSRISSRDLPCHKTKRSSSRAMSPSQAHFQLLWRRFVIRTFVCAHLKYFRSICIHVECIPCTRGHDKMSVLPDHRCLNYFSHIGLKFCLLPAIFCHPRIQIGIDLAAFDAKNAFPKGYFLPSLSQENFLKVSFPQ